MYDNHNDGNNQKNLGTSLQESGFCAQSNKESPCFIDQEPHVEGVAQCAPVASSLFGSGGTENLSTLATAAINEGLRILAAVASQKPRAQQQARVTSAMFGSRGTENLSTLATATVEACYDEGLGILAAVASQKPRVQQEVDSVVRQQAIMGMAAMRSKAYTAAAWQRVRGSYDAFPAFSSTGTTPSATAPVSEMGAARAAFNPAPSNVPQLPTIASVAEAQEASARQRVRARNRLLEADLAEQNLRLSWT